MIEQKITDQAQEAVIYLKNGNRKYGMLIDNDADENYRFISNTNYSSYKKDNNEDHVEIVPGISIEMIDTHLK